MSWNISAATRPADDAGNDLLVINLLIYELAFGCYSVANRAVNIGDWGDFCLRGWFSFLMINSEQVIETFDISFKFQGKLGNLPLPKARGGESNLDFV